MGGKGHTTAFAIPSGPVSVNEWSPEQTPTLMATEPHTPHQVVAISRKSRFGRLYYKSYQVLPRFPNVRDSHWCRSGRIPDDRRGGQRPRRLPLDPPQLG